MLFLDITGKSPKKLCENAIEWFVSEYLPRHKITIWVHHCGLKSEGVFGWCIVEDSVYRPRSFRIEIQRDLEKSEYLKTLFHELQHVLQYVRGDLKTYRGILYWNGQNCQQNPNMPEWELEAYKKQETLYQEYLTYLKTLDTPLKTYYNHLCQK